MQKNANTIIKYIRKIIFSINQGEFEGQTGFAKSCLSLKKHSTPPPQAVGSRFMRGKKFFAKISSPPNSLYFKTNNFVTVFFVLLINYCLIFQSCYSFKNVGIPPEINTFFIEQFDVQAFNAPAELGQNFSERLKDKIRQESRLRLVETDPDVTFSGSVSDFRVTSEAPQADQEVAFNRLTISVTVDYISDKNEEISWERPQRFSYFNDFDANQNLIDVQDELIENISQQLVEDIFNKAFTNW